jgi:hypothetical protein
MALPLGLSMADVFFNQIILKAVFYYLRKALGNFGSLMKYFTSPAVTERKKCSMFPEPLLLVMKNTWSKQCQRKMVLLRGIRLFIRY